MNKDDKLPVWIIVLLVVMVGVVVGVMYLFSIMPP